MSESIEDPTRAGRPGEAEGAGGAEPVPPQSNRDIRRTSGESRSSRRRKKERGRELAGTGSIEPGLSGGVSHGTRRKAARVAVVSVVVGALVVGALLAAALAINSVARWNARRLATLKTAPTEQEKKARDNVLVISEKDGKATGFLALRVDQDRKQVFGIAIPDGAFLEVPGQGFERVGDSYLVGPDVSMSAISNFLTVPFDRYVVVSEATYQEALRGQLLRGVMQAARDSNLREKDAEDLAEFLDQTPTEDVALVPLEVKPITLGAQTYFEPQREALADLLQSWWGVELSESEKVVRLIVYNGAGTPGIAGEAAQQLIRGGFRVVDTKNADTFDYKETQIVVQDKDMVAGEAVRKVLGTGKVIDQPSDQDVADVIVIIGKDYKPPKTPGGS